MIRVIFFLLLTVFYIKAQDFKVEQVVSNLPDTPWGMAFLDEKTMLITIKNGEVFHYDISKKKLSAVSNAPKVFYYSQGGLLDVQVSPNYKEDKWIYFTYSKEVQGEGATTLARAKLEGKTFNSWQELLVTNSATSKGAHFGSRITFDEEGYLYFGVGDRGIRDEAQNLSNHMGTIIRLNLDGTVPKDNPFVGRKDAKDEIYSYGHRNPQGLFYDKLTKRLYEIEHGPRGGDEINIIQKAQNYGWPVISYGKEYYAPIAVGEGTHKEGMIQPIKVYIPSIAPSSLIVYSGKVFKNWKGNLFSGALALRHLNRIVLNKDGKFEEEQRLLKSLNQRIRNVVESPEGLIYISTDSGNIYRLVP